MQRTNIYLDGDQLSALRRVADHRGLPVAVLVRQAIDTWLQAEGIQPISEDEWQRRFAALLIRRERTAGRGRFDAEAVARDVAAAVKEVRESKAARRR